jgi:hypothetical protein
MKKHDRYLSKTDHGWVVIYDGLPLNAGTSFPVAFQLLRNEYNGREDYWCGERGEWVSIIENVIGRFYGVRNKEWRSIYDIPMGAFLP